MELNLGLGTLVFVVLKVIKGSFGALTMFPKLGLNDKKYDKKFERL